MIPDAAQSSRCQPSVIAVASSPFIPAASQTLAGVLPDAPISGLVDTAARAVLKATATHTVRAGDTKTAGCAMERDDVLDVVLAPLAAPVADLQPATSFKGGLTYHFSATEGSVCDDQLAASGGDFTTLPCDVRYALAGARTGDAK